MRLRQRSRNGLVISAGKTAAAGPPASTSSGPSTYTSASVGRSANSAAGFEPPGSRVARSISPAPSCRHRVTLPGQDALHRGEYLDGHRVRFGDEQPGPELPRVRRQRTAEPGQRAEVVQVRSLVDAAPDLLRHRGRGGRHLGYRGTRARQPGQAHPGAPGQPPVDRRQAQRYVTLARRRPVADAPGQLARADQRAGRAGRERGGGRDEQLAELRDQAGGTPGTLPRCRESARPPAGCPDTTAAPGRRTAAGSGAGRRAGRRRRRAWT